MTDPTDPNSPRRRKLRILYNIANIKKTLLEIEEILTDVYRELKEGLEPEPELLPPPRPQPPKPKLPEAKTTSTHPKDETWPPEQTRFPRYLHIGGHEITLTAYEGVILKLLLKHRSPVSWERCAMVMYDGPRMPWSHSDPPQDGRTNVRVHIHKLRKKIAGHLHIETITGAGYLIEDKKDAKMTCT
jgi:hypothetical protein